MAVGRTMHADGPIGRMLVASGFNKNDLIRSTGIGPARAGELISGADGPTIAELAYLAKAFGVPPRAIVPSLTDEQL